jgi:transcriptional regulator with XRE-family HTH domain
VSQVRELIQHIKRKLRSAGLTYKELADRIDVSESTLKRWFSQNSFNIEHLDQICGVLAIDLGDILPQRRRRLALEVLTEQQELELAADEALLAVFYLAVSGKTAQDIVARFDVTPVKLRTHLIRLDHLELIELHPEDRIVPLVSQSVRWLPKGPLNEKYGQQIKHDFMESDFRGKHEREWLLSGPVSRESLAVFDRKLDALLAEFRGLMDLDAALEPGQTVNMTFFAAHRPWGLPLFKDRRKL